ncbi:unnamed protein product [Phaedon cochleariae]|uniref:Exoribonuclease phosphorolytic domain-containing protein n=1 Tax=Phaedon cochleariae TaxID=80249 RepID=A0A9P0DHC0_PHACE|nr:unnamed protein product [Phaedon cochleariae]
MPLDHKRINGPDETLPYSLFAKQSTPSWNQIFKELQKEGKRSDARGFLDHRKVFLKTGIVSQAKGSAYIELDNSKVIVSVFDPHEIPNRQDYSLKGEIYCEFKFAPFSCKKRRLHQKDNEENQYSAIMKQALESTVCRHEFPNFQVDIYALVLHNDGSCLSAAITAAGIALSHAGVPMYDIITSVTLGIQKDMILLDPNVLEQSLCSGPILDDTKNSDHGIVVISILNNHNQISQFYQSGMISLEKLNQTVELLQKACSDLVPLIQKCLVKHVIKTLKSSGEG